MRFGKRARMFLSGLVGIIVCAAAVAQDTTPPTVTELRADGVLLPDGSTLFSEPAEITVTFDEPMDPATINENTIRLVRAGGDGTFSDGNEVEIALSPGDVTLDGTGMVATVHLISVTLPDDAYQVALLGTDVTAGLLGHWRLDETSGTIAQDSSGNGNVGTLVNGPSWYLGGRIGGALDFDGSNDYVDCGSGIPDQPAVVTQAAWLKTSTDGVILTKRHSGGYPWPTL